jgi:hypothetical protein
MAGVLWLFNREEFFVFTQEYLKSRLDYDPETGLFRWKAKAGDDRETRRWNSAWAGKTAGGPNQDGYVRIGLVGLRFLAHRLAWLYMTGSWPTDEIDHENRQRADNRFVNLKPVTHFQNAQNREVGRSGIRGVKAKGTKWLARIRKDGKGCHLGSFPTAEAANAAYIEAARKIHGEFSHH